MNTGSISKIEPSDDVSWYVMSRERISSLRGHRELTQKTRYVRSSNLKQYMWLLPFYSGASLFGCPVVLV